MRGKLGFLLVLIGFIALIVGGMKFLSSRAPKQGVLKVNSNPTVSVFLDNKHIGRSSLEEKVDSGDFTVKLVPESTVEQIASWQGNIRISPNLLTFVNADLAQSDFTTAVDVLWLEKISSKDSEISITTNPDGATVTLDGETKGITPLSLSAISVGDHTLNVASPGFVTRTVKLKTTSGYKVVVTVKLALTEGTSPTPQATPSATVTPKTTPAQGGSEPKKPYIIIKDTPTGFLRVRMDASTSATEAARVNPGEKYTILDTQNGWYQIRYDGTNDGWVSGQYATKVE